MFTISVEPPVQPGEAAVHSVQMLLLVGRTLEFEVLPETEMGRASLLNVNGLGLRTEAGILGQQDMAVPPDGEELLSQDLPLRRLVVGGAETYVDEGLEDGRGPLQGLGQLPRSTITLSSSVSTALAIRLTGLPGSTCWR